MSSTKGRISAAPSEQLTPTISGRACSTESQNASTVWPERLRPLLSIAVNESQSGSSGASSSAAAIAAFALSESKTVSTARCRRRRRAARAIWCAYASRTSSNVTARYAGSSTRGESDSVTLSGPTAPATKRGLSGVFAVQASAALPREPRAFEVHLAHDVGAERVVRLPDRRRRERVGRRDVGAGREVVVVDPRDDLGPRDVQEIGVARDVVRVLAEPLAPVRLLAAQLALDEDAPGAVEHGDPFAEDALEALTRFRHSICSRQVSPGARNRAHGLFRRLVTRSPSCLSKLSG